MTHSRILFDGKGLKLKDLGDGVREIEFDLVGESANRFSSLMLADLNAAWSIVEKDADARGVLMTTAKDGFFVGADRPVQFSCTSSSFFINSSSVGASGRARMRSANFRRAIYPDTR